MSEFVFSRKSNYSESHKAPINKKGRIIIKSGVERDFIPSIDNLPDGEYKARWYGYTLELDNGDKYKTKTGVRNTRRFSRIQMYTVKDGNVTQISKSYSGLGEVGAGQQGMSYGHKINDPLIYNPTRISIDTKGFRIPDKIKKELMIQDRKFSVKRTKSYAMADGRFVGTQHIAPSVKISDDNSIIRNTSNGGTLKAVGTKPSGGTSVTSDTKRPFNLSVDPWIVSPLMSDTNEGIYVGKLLGDKITSGNSQLMLSIKLNKELPEDVVVFVRDGKAYIFKIAQLGYKAQQTTHTFSDGGKCPSTGCIEKDSEGNWRVISNKTGAYWPQKYKSEDTAKKALAGYHASKGFSEITNDEQFRSWVHNTMKNAHKDKYDEAKTDKVVDGLLEKHQGADYGELIGRVKSSLKTKHFADPADPSQPSQPSQGAQPAQQSTPGGDVNNQPTDPSGAPTGDPNQQGAGAAPMPNPNINPSKDEAKEAGYSFEYTVSSQVEYTMEQVIGNILFSITFMHLFHLCTTNYIYHKSIDDYYKKMPDLIDKLAEAFLASTDTATFKLSIVPSSGNPIEYLEKLKEYLNRYIDEKAQDDRFKQFASYFDPIMELINSTIYPMKRLKEGKKTFSISTNIYSKNSWRGAFKINKGGVDQIRDSLTDIILSSRKRPGKNPFPDVKSSNGREVRQYVQDHTTDEESTVDFIKTVMNALAVGVKGGMKY